MGWKNIITAVNSTKKKYETKACDENRINFAQTFAQFDKQANTFRIIHTPEKKRNAAHTHLFIQNKALSIVTHAC